VAHTCHTCHTFHTHQLPERRLLVTLAPPLLLLLLPLSLGTCQRPSPPPLRGTHRTAAVPGRSCCGSWRAEPTSMAHLQPHVRGSAPTPCRPVRAGRVCQLSEPACQLSGATACQWGGRPGLTEDLAVPAPPVAHRPSAPRVGPRCRRSPMASSLRLPRPVAPRPTPWPGTAEQTGAIRVASAGPTPAGADALLPAAAPAISRRRCQRKR
jgi:hypothetical protein